MLKEEQAAELLKRCEMVVGGRLNQVRGNLRNAETRAAAVWELLVLDEASRIGEVEYEPYETGSPDILLKFKNGDQIWIEVAFLYPRFWKQERESQEVTLWVYQEAERRGIAPFKISCRFDGDSKNQAGPVRSLPKMHEKKKFISSEEVRGFFESVESKPNSRSRFKHSCYSLEIGYSPSEKGPFVHSSGLVQESPKDVKQHALYRVIREKAKQHQVDGKRMVCIGSDQSHALSSLYNSGGPSYSDAVLAAFGTTKSLSGVIVFRIENSKGILGGLERIARGDVYINEECKEPLAESDIAKIKQLNLNRWKYTFSIDKFEAGQINHLRRLSGDLVMSQNGNVFYVEVPGHVLADSLLGKANLIEQFGMSNNPAVKLLQDGWVIKGCSWRSGNIEKGEPSRVILELAPPAEAVYWPK